MCGLIGAAGSAADLVEPDEMLGLVEHRGPDSQGYASDESWILGHTRLAIQDPSDAAAQPYQAGSTVVTYNGELWNAKEIQVSRPLAGHGDTPVVAAALEEYGEAALERFDGMWAVAWATGDGQIKLARDRWGKVPLYWATDGGTVYWASEYKALPHGMHKEPVQPGHVVTIDPTFGCVVENRCWSKDNPMVDLEPEPEVVLDLLTKGVRERLVGDRSIAFMLSGGLDSTLILALAAQLYHGRVIAYTAVLDPASPDLAAARWVAEHYGVELVEVPVPVPTEESILEAVRTIEIPMKAQVEIALAHMPVMEQVAKDGHAVCLSGESADELFGGYGGMCIKASKTDDAGYRAIKLAAVEKMARGNFSRVNKVGMRYGVECRLPFMQADLVELALNASKAESPPGKKLLKAAARGVVPDRIIKRPKDTFQGAVGTASAAAHFGGVSHYNHHARDLFGFLPKE